MQHQKSRWFKTVIEMILLKRFSSWFFQLKLKFILKRWRSVLKLTKPKPSLFFESLVTRYSCYQTKNNLTQSISTFSYLPECRFLSQHPIKNWKTLRLRRTQLWAYWSWISKMKGWKYSICSFLDQTELNVDWDA